MKKCTMKNADVVNSSGVSTFIGDIFLRYKIMNSSSVGISILMNSRLSKKCLINALMSMSSESLRSYLELANIYKGISPKKKTNLVEMIVFGCITNKINKHDIKDISTKETNEILSEHKIKTKSLPGHGNAGLKKKEILEYASNELSIKVHD